MKTSPIPPSLIRDPLLRGVSMELRYVYIALDSVSMADGRIPNDIDFLTDTLFPQGDVSPGQFKNWIPQLVHAGLLIAVQMDDGRYKLYHPRRYTRWQRKLAREALRKDQHTEEAEDYDQDEQPGQAHDEAAQPERTANTDSVDQVATAAQTADVAANVAANVTTQASRPFVNNRRARRQQQRLHLAGKS